DRNLVDGVWGRKAETWGRARFSWKNGSVKTRTSEAGKQNGEPSGRIKVEISEIRVYPIKSCAGFEVPKGERWELMETGLRYDREWCLVHLGTNRALDQKQYVSLGSSYLYFFLI